MEWVGYLAGVLTTVCFVPQAWKIIRHHQSRGVSLWMYMILSTGVACWLAYGIILDSMPMMFFNSISLILNLLIVYKLVVLKRQNPNTTLLKDAS